MIFGAVLLAIICWAFTFGLCWGNFWVKIGLSVIIICLYSSYWQRPKIHFSSRAVFIGIISAVLLYGIFYLGYVLSPYIVPGAAHQIGGIYDMGTGTDKRFIFLLLLFVTGPGEEIFWRGFLQDRLMVKYGDLSGFVVTTLIYGGVHIFSLNFILVMAALVAGAFWGRFISGNAIYPWLLYPTRYGVR